MTYATVCSGIEAPSVAWHTLGWKPVFFSEIEKFPCAVLKHHYPDVPNYGDMTQYAQWPSHTIDVICGGTPCQSFSVAGLRKGISDPRGNLALVYLGVIDKYRPTWVVWENVPGVISSGKGEDLKSFLDGLEDLGYIIDIDILDSQFYSVPQRRRRVFVCAQNRDVLIQEKTDSSALTIAQCLVEILHGILTEKFKASERGLENSELAFLSKDGILRRMKLFKITTEKSSYEKLQKNLIEAFRRYQNGQKKSAAIRGEKEKELILEDQLTVSKMDRQFSLTEEMLKKTLEEIYEVMKLYITSTETSLITPSQIFIFSKAALNIARLILLLNPLSPPSWSAASSSLTLLRELINYARQSSNDLFGYLDWIPAWCDFVTEANRTVSDIERHLGNWTYPAAVLFERESLCGNPAPRRKTGEEVAGRIAPCLNDSGGHSRPGDNIQSVGMLQVARPLRGQPNQTHREDSDNYIAMCLNSKNQRLDGESQTFITHTLKAEHDASEDGTGRGVPLVAWNPQTGGDCRYGFTDTPNLQAHQIPAVGVRRLLPRECERLQGFPDDYTLIPYRGKPACDGPRYKALGNSMAVPVVRWIGQRIQQVQKIIDGPELEPQGEQE